VSGVAVVPDGIGVAADAGRSTCVDVDVVVDGPVANADPAVIGPARTLTPIIACAMRRTSIGLVLAAIAVHPRPAAPGSVLATSRKTVTPNHPRPIHAASAAEPPSS